MFDDDDITPEGIIPRQDGRVSFLVGWNFTTHLYRILEHALDDMRRRRQNPDHCGRVTALYANKAGPSVAEVLDCVAALYSELPIEFKGAKAMTGNLQHDRYGYQGR